MPARPVANRAARDVKAALSNARQIVSISRRLTGSGALSDPVQRAQQAREMRELALEICDYLNDALYMPEGVTAPDTEP